MPLGALKGHRGANRGGGSVTRKYTATQAVMSLFKVADLKSHYPADAVTILQK